FCYSALSSFTQSLCLDPLLSHQDLHSFPTRRSSDLNVIQLACIRFNCKIRRLIASLTNCLLISRQSVLINALFRSTGLIIVRVRSEEQTSELQSRFELVCSPLLEIKIDVIEAVW